MVWFVMWYIKKKYNIEKMFPFDRQFVICMAYFYQNILTKSAFNKGGDQFCRVSLCEPLHKNIDNLGFR